MSAPRTSAPPSPPGSGRVSHYIGMTNRAAKNSDVEAANAGVPPHERDLVTRLINDPKNKPVWEGLVNNPFCQAMKEAGNHDHNVLRGFEWYMKQDYHYIAGLVEFEADRFAKAETSDDFDAMIARVSGTVQYTSHFFKACTTSQPHGLGISASTLLQTKQCAILKEYIKLFTTIAEEEDEVFSLVAMIAGLQSYAVIAADLYRYSVHQDTLWYQFWAEDNFGLGKPALVQQKYFMDNYASWKDRYEKASEIFRKTCELELALWNEAVKNSNPNA